jgi:ATP-dependent Zn protease
MNRSMRRPQNTLLGLCLTLALLTLGAGATAGLAGAADVIRFQHESYTEFQKQLDRGQIHAATFNKKAHTVHVTLQDGRHVLASYPSHNEPRIAAQLRAKGVSVKVKTHKKVSAVHHTLRYIAGAIVVIIILVILVVLLIGRRRNLVEAEDSSNTGGSVREEEPVVPPVGAAPPAGTE